MKRIFAGIICALMVIGVIPAVSGCGSSEKLRVYNWGIYIDREVIKMFEKETGIKVQYMEYDSNEIMYTKVKKSRAGSYDLLIPSDYMISKMISEDMLEPLNMENIPNFQYIMDSMKDMDYDPGNKYSVPYMWGTLAIIYDKTKVTDPVDTWAVLWNEKYAKKIFMMDSVRDSFAIALKLLGYSVNTRNKDELAAAKAKLIEQKPLILDYTGDDLGDKMVAGEGVLGVIYVGEGLQALSQNPNLAMSIPSKEGSNLFFDAMVIPKGSPNKEKAEMFINFMCRQDIAEMNRAEIQYSTPQQQVYDALPAEVKNNPIQYPPQKVLDACEVYVDLGDMYQYYVDLWTDILVNK